MTDDSSQNAPRPAAQLLNELESIKGALDTDGSDSNELPANIPLLDDMVIDNLNANASLLDIEQIFEDDAITAKSVEIAAAPPMQFPRFTLNVAVSDSEDECAATFEPPAPPAAKAATPSPAPSAKAQVSVQRDYSREVLIQELVDEFIPQIEAALHERLRELDTAALQALLKSSK